MRSLLNFTLPDERFLRTTTGTWPPIYAMLKRGWKHLADRSLSANSEQFDASGRRSQSKCQCRVPRRRLVQDSVRPSKSLVAAATPPVQRDSEHFASSSFILRVIRHLFEAGN